MSKKKDVLLFGNAKELVDNNRIIGMGIGAVLVGLITIGIGEYRSGKLLIGFSGETEHGKGSINSMYEDLKQFMNK
jgi:hypothetical protein